MTSKPQFITFTGVDQFTDPREMRALADKYPIEWGILFSPKRQGSGRYPPIEFVRDLVLNHRLFYSAHLCGGHSSSVISYGHSGLEDLVRGNFERSQINTADPKAVPSEIARWALASGVVPILQCRNGFPLNPSVVWLFDASGGRGIEPSEWPAPPDKNGFQMVGYAGGLRPDNVAAHVERIGLLASRYWIDMETGVRDENDRFDLAKCRAVCEAVYGR